MKNSDEAYYVYVVDDNPNVLTLLKKLIRTEYNIQVRTFSNAEECLELISKREPDCVISDFNLNPFGEKNRMNGDELLNFIKHHYPNIRVILYSSSTELNTIIDLLKSGAFDFVSLGTLFEKRFSVSIGNALKDVHDEREFIFERKAILHLVGLMLLTNIIFYFIDVNFTIYLLICLLPPLFFIFLLGYFKYFFRKDKSKIQFGKIFFRRREYKIFVVDDSEIYRLMITNALDKERAYFHPGSYVIKTFASAEKCLKEMSSKPDILILDYLLEDSDDQIRKMNGMKMLGEVKRISPETKVIMISSQKDASVVSDLLKEGAQDYIVKDQLWQNKIRSSTHRLLKLRKNRKWGLLRWWQKWKLKPAV
jgi:DNA-binding NtrC family response regulator